MSEASLPLYLPLLALIAAVGAVAALYRLKPPPRTVVVPSGLVWDRVLRDSHASPDRLRWWLSLLLAALIAALIAGAVVPFGAATVDATGSKLIVVLDNSPTMATRTTDGSSRWEHARARARSLMLSRTAGTQIWLADTMRRIPMPAFQNRDDALEQLAQLQVSHGLAPVLSLPDRSADVETVVVTDGVSIGPLPAQVRLESVFESVENAGITAFEVRALPADSRRYMAYVELVNASGIEKRIELAVAGVGGRRVSRVKTMPPGGVIGELIDISDFAGGPVRASVAMPGDGFAADDVAYSVLPVHRVMRVGLVTAGNAFLEKSLRAQPRVNVTVIAPARYMDDRDYDAIVFDRFAPAVRPRVPALLFRPSRADWLPAMRKEVANVSVAAWNAAHPLLENISLIDVSADQAVLVDLKDRPGNTEPVLASATGGMPLIVAHENGARWILFSFALDESNFALHAGFPIFLNNALSWMLDEQALVSRGLGLVDVPVPDARVVAADGKELLVQSIPGGSLFEADAPGLFTVVSARQRLRVAANLLDRRITEINKSPLAQAKPDVDVPDIAARAFAFDAWFALLLAAASLLLFEWWSWNRRMTV